MDFVVNQAVKVLRGGRSWHGGEHAWPLPTRGADGEWTPGEWTPAVTPSMCSQGWHLTREPALWWGEDTDVGAYLAEWDGAHVEREDKIAVERCRLLRPLTRAEMESCGVFTEGTHAVSSGSAWASGSATVDASGSATVWASGSATVRASGSATVWASGSATVRASGSATVWASGSATVRASGSATVWASGSATVDASGSATVRAWDSATVDAWGSAKSHVCGRGTATAWSGTTVALTRAEYGVLIDRRGDGAPKVYVKRAGLDGWRYRDGAWVQVKVRAKATVA